MNKAKFIFATLVTLAAIGGVFAFKANKFTGAFGHSTSLGTITFRTAVGGPIYTAQGVVYCTATTNVTFEGPGEPTIIPTTVIQGTITGTAPNGLTTSTILIYKNCSPAVHATLTEIF